MPDHDGFELIRRIGVSAMPAVVFITAYDDYALKAFEVNAVDYLLKPFEDARFYSAIAKARDAVRQRQAEMLGSRLTRLLHFLEKQPSEASDAASGHAPFSDRILVKSSGEIFFLKAEEIDWIEAEGDYMVFHVAGKTHLLRETMARLEARLDPKRFIRIHRSTIVNVDRVKKLTPSFVGEYAVVLNDGTKLKLSRSYHERLQSVLKQAL
jgi:two-component system LytT family response regulator